MAQKQQATGRTAAHHESVAQLQGRAASLKRLRGGFAGASPRALSAGATRDKTQQNRKRSALQSASLGRRGMHDLLSCGPIGQKIIGRSAPDFRLRLDTGN